MAGPGVIKLLPGRRANPHRGQVAITIDDTPLIVVMDWSAIDQLKEIFGPEFDVVIGQACNDFDLAALADVLAIGLIKHHDDEWPPARIRAASPPLVPVIQAIRRSLNLAFNGPGDLDDEPDPDPARRRRTGRGSWRRLWRRRSNAGSLPTPSGA